MKATTKTARQEIKRLLTTVGYENILNEHFTEIVERTGITYFDLQCAMNYYNYGRAHR